MTRIAIDAMGGDHAPHEIVAGAVWGAQDYGVAIELVGKQDRIEQELDRIAQEGIYSDCGTGGKKRRISKEESLFGLVPVLRQDESAYRFFCIKQAEKLRKKAAGIEIQNMDCSDVIKLEEHARKLADSPLFWDRICFTSAAAKPVKNMQT